MKGFDFAKFKNMNICVDCEKVCRGDVFVLLKKQNGKKKIRQALKRGAKLILAEKSYGMDCFVVVKNARKTWALIEKEKNGCACDHMKIIGVTGTNGKTTTTNFIANILKSAKKKVAVIGTLGAFFEGERFETDGLTTPDPNVLHKLFALFYAKGAEYVVMEVSAHALALEKLAGVKFDVAVLTNITQDHLDFFKSMKKYKKAKYKIFSQTERAVVCGDCIKRNEFTRKVALPTMFYGFNSDNEVYAKVLSSSFDKNVFFCHTPKFSFQSKIKLSGSYNILNALASVCVCICEDIDAHHIIKGLSSMNAVEGRFNVKNTFNKKIVIDFAHTPDGLKNLIQNVKPLAKGDVITVFGCGGNRDKKKRSVMGKIATTLSDQVVLTSDNPRFEDPNLIIKDILKKVNKKCKIYVEPNREKAIKVALSLAKKDDAVIIAGKGGEKYQDIAGTKVPYDDFEVVERLLQKGKGEK